MSLHVAIFEDKKFANFFPLTVGRPVFDLRLGTGSLRSRMLDGLARTRVSLMCREYLTDVVALTADAAVNPPVTGATLFVNARLLCFGDERERLLASLEEDSIAIKGGYVVAARLGKAPAVAFAEYVQGRLTDEAMTTVASALRAAAVPVGEAPAPKKRGAAPRSATAGRGPHENDFALGQDNLEEKLPLALDALITAHRLRRVDVPHARLLSFPWQLIEFNSAAITDDFARLPVRGQAEDCVIFPGVQIVTPEQVVLGERAVIRAGAVLDASAGPILIGDRAVVMPNAVVIGPACVGPDAIVKSGARILEGTSIGPTCKVGGEVEETIFAAYSNKQHDGFLGHSYIGEWVNLGAASNNSDLKNNYSPVRMWCAGDMRETGRQFLGLLMGDHTKTGINTLFNTGTVVGFNCNVFSSEMPDKFVPSFSWGQGLRMEPYDVQRAIQTAAAVMERRRIKFGPAHRALFEKIHALCEASGRNL